METTSAQDRALLEAMVLGKRSGDDLSRAVGGLLTPEEAVLRAHTILNGHDVLGVVQEFQLLLWKTRQLVEKAEDAYEGGNENALRLVLDTLKFIFAQLEKRESALKEVEVKINAAYAEIMLEAISRSLKATAKEIAETHEITLVEIEGVFERQLPLAAAAIDAETVSE